ncbi:glycosyltransferase involved in cell wall biosynthesis [Actinoplanes tereljensis]|uniref:Dolichol-P-glucose synthetase n=1 Tax=Paractinoplanes tereljensis TaxID=571912 RepID=A0A919TQQ3_9ACTN|nr:glycosyltransferase family 2 protein [Actinoplanes tereljensis]GIF18531.1 dolichol-P-glucose synthetase [Actinoplanes tereljensis]
MPQAPDDLEVTVLLPCLNEAETLEVCVRKALGSLAELGVHGEVLVSDNGSTDGSQAIAVAAGARVVHAPIRGYGGALLNGIEQARGKYIIMADADDSYDLANLGPFIEGLRAGHDVVMGNRFRGGIMPGAMPPLHRYLGNPVLSWLGRALIGLKGVNDFHCGIRGFHRERIRELQLCMPGMEFASELVVRAKFSGYDMAEVPTTLRPDGRSRPPHLRTWRDGWRHLRFLLVFAPRRTLVWPGLIIFLVGLVSTTALATGPRAIGGVEFDINALAYACVAVLVGFQLILFGGYAELYGRFEGLVRDRDLSRWARWLSFERCVALGLAVIALGVAGTIAAVADWGAADFGNLDPRGTIRLVLPSATAIAIGVVGVFAGLFSSLLTLRGVRKDTVLTERIPRQRQRQRDRDRDLVS